MSFIHHTHTWQATVMAKAIVAATRTANKPNGQVEPQMNIERQDRPRTTP